MTTAATLIFCPTPSDDRINWMRIMRNAGEDVTPRLMYRDWLEENGESSPLDLATIHFIGLTCHRLKKDRLYPAAYKWFHYVRTLDAPCSSWDLFPSFWALHSFAPNDTPRFLPVGRWVRMVFYRWHPERPGVMTDRNARNVRITVHAELWHGFVRRFNWFDVEHYRLYAHYFTNDQPLAVHSLCPAAVPYAVRASQISLKLAAEHGLNPNQRDCWECGYHWMAPVQFAFAKGAPPWQFITATTGIVQRVTESQEEAHKKAVEFLTQRLTVEALARSVWRDILSDREWTPYTEQDHVNARRVHINGMENFWSLLKRALKGSYVHVAPFHLERYVDEEVFRFNERAKNDWLRFWTTLKGAVGRRLTYRELCAVDGAGFMGIT